MVVLKDVLFVRMDGGKPVWHWAIVDTVEKRTIAYGTADNSADALKATQSARQHSEPMIRA